MCDIGLALLAAGTAMSAIGSNQQAKAQKTANRRVAEAIGQKNKRIADLGEQKTSALIEGLDKFRPEAREDLMAKQEDVIASVLRGHLDNLDSGRKDLNVGGTILKNPSYMKEIASNKIKETENARKLAALTARTTAPGSERLITNIKANDDSILNQLLANRMRRASGLADNAIQAAGVFNKNKGQALKDLGQVAMTVGGASAGGDLANLAGSGTVPTPKVVVT